MNKKLLAYSLRRLAARMMTEGDLRAKMQTRVTNYKDIDIDEDELPKCIDEVIKYLIKEHLINDREYVKLYLEYESSTNFRGKFGYWQKLMKKGIDKDLFEDGWEELDIDEYKLAKKLLENNDFRFVKESNEQKRKAKIQRFLKGRGFDFSIIIELTK